MGVGGTDDVQKYNTNAIIVYVRDIGSFIILYVAFFGCLQTALARVRLSLFKCVLLCAFIKIYRKKTDNNNNNNRGLISIHTRWQ